MQRPRFREPAGVVLDHRQDAQAEHPQWVESRAGLGGLDLVGHPHRLIASAREALPFASSHCRRVAERLDRTEVVADAERDIAGSVRDVRRQGIPIDVPGGIGVQEEDPDPIRVGQRDGHVVDRPAHQLESLPMGRHRHGLLRSGEGCPERFLGHPGPLEMDGCVDRRRALQQAAELGRPSVVAAALARRDRPIERIAQELVPEVVLLVVADRIEDVVVDELLDRIVEGLDGEVHDPGEDGRHERPPEDRSGAGDGLRLG